MSLHLANYTPAQLPPAAATPPPAPKGAQWLTVDDAARRAGKDPGHIRRLCAEVWMAGGLARLERPEGGGKTRWLVRDDAAPELARVKGADQIGTDLSHLTDTQRIQVADRKRLLDDWKAILAVRGDLGLSEINATKQFLMMIEARGGKPVCRRTLVNLRTRFREGGLAALADGRGRSAAGDGADDLTSIVFERVKDLYLTTRKWSVRRCYDLAMGEQMIAGRIQCLEDGPHHTTIWRRIQQIPKAVVTLRREGAEAFKNIHESNIQRDYSGLASNQIWCGDHHRFDVFVKTPDGKVARPWLTAWMDVRSRYVVGYHIALTDPNTDTILRAFRAGCLQHGVPQEVQIDNGKDYDARALQGMTKKQRRATKGSRASGTPAISESAARLVGVFPILGVAVNHVQPFHGQGKNIERLFGTIEDRFGRLFETYCGSSPENRPDDVFDQVDRGAAPTLEEFCQDFADYLRDDYHLAKHQGDAMDGGRPTDVFAACLVTKRTATAEQLHFACMPRFGPFKVGQHGVRYQGMNFGGFSPEVAGLHGQRVNLAVDLDDLSYVSIVSLEGRLLCRAPQNHKLPFKANAEDLRAGLAEKRKTRRVVMDYHQRRTRLGEDTRGAVLRAAAQRAANESAGNQDSTNPTTPPPSLSPVRTPFDDQLAQLRPTGTDGAGGLNLRIGQPDPTEDRAFIYRPAADSAVDSAAESAAEPEFGNSFLSLMRRAEDE